MQNICKKRKINELKGLTSPNEIEMIAAKVPNSTANQDVHAFIQKFRGILSITSFKLKLHRSALHVYAYIYKQKHK